jgi:hypothetical protein
MIFLRQLSLWHVAVRLQYKDRINTDLIRPAVDWRKIGVASNTMKAAVAKQWDAPRQPELWECRFSSGKDNLSVSAGEKWLFVALFIV